MLSLLTANRSMGGKDRYIPTARFSRALEAMRKMQASLDERQAKGKQIVIPFDGKPQKTILRCGSPRAMIYS
jgi:hypothetical protein